jgi:hypothetical protein
MPEVLPELQAYLGAQMPGQGLALGVLGGAWVVLIAKAIIVPPCDSPASGGVPGIMTSLLLVSGVRGLARCPQPKPYPA